MEVLGHSQGCPHETCPFRRLRMSRESGHVLADASSLLEATLDRGAEVDSAVQPRDGRLLRGRRERAERAWG
jgi:hypothetical protein